MASTPQLWSDFPALQLVHTGRLVRLMGRVTFFALLLSVIGMIFLPWRQTARGTGVVVALDPQERPQPLLSPSKGVISYVKPGLREGSYVEKNELLIRLTPFAEGGVLQIDTQIMAIESKRVAAEASMEFARQAVDLQRTSGQSQIGSLEQDVEAARQKWEQSKNEIVALQAELEDKRNQLNIAEAVITQGLISREELFTKRRAVDSQYAKVLKAEGAAEEAYATLVSKENDIEAKKRDIDIKNRSASQKELEEIQKLRTIEKELLDQQMKRSELDRMEIRTPRSGFIQQWYGQEGSDTIKEGDQLFLIVPDATQLSVELKISGNDMPLIQEGDRVRLQFEGWPAVQFVGWPSVAVGTFGGKVNRVFPTDDGKGFFQVVVIPDRHFDGENDWPDRRYLRQGVRANGWILLQQVSLGYEIWRQLNGFPPVIVPAEPKKSGSGSETDKAKLPKF